MKLTDPVDLEQHQTTPRVLLCLVGLLVLGCTPAHVGAMRAVALVSGGKDSTMNMMRCVEHGHSIVALANLYRESTAAKYLMHSFLSPNPMRPSRK